MKAVAGRFVVAAALLVGCDKKPLQNDAGSGGIGLLDGGQGLPLDGGPIDAPPSFSGIRSFVVTSQIQSEIATGPIPSSHTFTLVLDGDRQTAIFGSAGTGYAAEFSPLAGGAYRIAGAYSFAVEGATCSGSSILYSEIRFAFDDSGRLTGLGSGQVFFSGDVAPASTVTMSLSGVADRQGPTLRITTATNEPFGNFLVAASEPLPPTASLALRALDGETLGMAALGLSGGFVSAFQKPGVVLRYATQYEIVGSGLADFAGNAPVATGGLVFTTLPRPPLAIEDGFESLVPGMYGGVQALSGAGEPTITGTTSLYVPSYDPVTTVFPFTLTLRLPVSSGDTVVRFSYRTVNGNDAGVTYLLGSEGGMRTAPTLPSELPALTPATISGNPVMLGPLRTASFPLPPGVTNEVVLRRAVIAWFGCGPPPPIVPGVIIDDLRVE